MVRVARCSVVFAVVCFCLSMVPGARGVLAAPGRQAAGVTLQSLKLYTDLNDDGTPAGGPVSTALVTQDHMAAFAVISAWSGYHAVSITWLAPDGSFYAGYTDENSHSGGVSLYSAISIANHLAATKLGTWTVTLSSDGATLGSVTFTLTAPGTAPTPQPQSTPTAAPAASYHVPDTLWPHASQIDSFISENGGELVDALHPNHPLAGFGRINGLGFQEEVNWHATGTVKVKGKHKRVTSPFSAYYVASVFPTATSAAAAFRDARAYFGKDRRVVNGKFAVGDQNFLFVGKGQSFTDAIAAFTRGRVLVEMGLSGPRKYKGFTVKQLAVLRAVATYLDGQAKLQG